MRSHRRRQHGLTLIEVLVAIGIGIVGISGALLMVVAAIRGAGVTRTGTEAMALVQQKLEQEVSRVTVPAAGTSTTETVTGLGDAVVAGTSSGATQFTRTTTWSDTGRGTTMVLVRVQWTDLFGAHTREGSRERNPR